jgi:hypothetical protein
VCACGVGFDSPVGTNCFQRNLSLLTSKGMAFVLAVLTLLAPVQEMLMPVDEREQL